MTVREEKPTPAAFKECGSCRWCWPSFQALVDDPGVRLLGLQVAPQLPAANLFVFEHRCGSTVSVLASRVRDLLSSEPRDESLPNRFGTDECSKYCQSLGEGRVCERECANAVDRRLLAQITRP